MDQEQHEEARVDRVWVVNDSDYDPGSLVAAFTSESAAHEFIELVEQRHGEDYWFSSDGPIVEELPLYKGAKVAARDFENERS